MQSGSPQQTSPPPLTRTARLLNACRKLLRVLRDPRARSEWVTRHRQKGLHFQGDTFTFPNRFAALFDHCRLTLQHLREPRVLSFGCATGEEVTTLRQYLPRAEVFGVDINRWCLRQCELQHRHPQAHFLFRHSEEFAALPPVDAIFCMAVFQRTENRYLSEEAITKGFQFKHFAQEIAILDSKLVPGGLLYIDHCDFRFEDTATAAHYDIVQSDASQRMRERHLYGPDNRLLALKYRANRIFVKQGGAAGLPADE